MTPITTTFLEMTDAAQIRRSVCPDGRFRVLEATLREWQVNRFLYQLIGAPWAWRDRLVWTDDQWRGYVEDERLRTFTALYDGSLAGYVELSRRDREVEIASLGIVPSLFGRGMGGGLLTRALEEAWAMDPTRVWVHTCTLDHPAALANYLARGMVVFKTEISSLNGIAQATVVSPAEDRP